MNPYEAYQLFLALKQHFTRESYDYFKYNGKVNARVSAFESRKDKYQFYKLSKQKDPQGLVLSNLLENTNLWIGDLFDSKANDVYLNWMKRQQSITYIFTNECEKLLTTFDENFIVHNGQYPPLLKLYNRGDICHETIVILNSIVKFFPHWKKNITDTVIWPAVQMKLEKYRPFVNYDEKKCKTALRQLYHV